MPHPHPLPDPFTHLPRYPLLYPHPSPIHPLPALTAHLSSSSPVNPPTQPPFTLYAKREDHSSPLACAGNKYRKLEYIVPDILSPSPSPSRDAAPAPTPATTTTTLVTEGAVQSNHTIQVTAVAQRLGLKAVVLLGKNVGGGLAAASDKDTFLRLGNVQIARLLGAEIRFPDDEPAAGTDEVDPVEKVLNELRRDGSVPYWIPSGASLHPLGGLGYARCAFEISMQEQEQEKDLSGSGRFDYIFVACGSGSTVGGLIAGFKLLEKLEEEEGRSPRPSPRKVIGILNSPTKPSEHHKCRVLDFARRAAGWIGLDPERDITMDDVRLDDRFVGSAYGVLDPETRRALELMAQKEGVLLDPVYTAKVLRGMMHSVQHGELALPPSQHVNALFIHTGGQSALGAYADVD